MPGFGQRRVRRSCIFSGMGPMISPLRWLGRIAVAISLPLLLSACVNSRPPSADLGPLKAARATVIVWPKGEVGVLPQALVHTVRLCWAPAGPLVDFRVSEPVARGEGVVALQLDGPLKGDPPQRFVVVITPAPVGKSGYRVDLDYPVGANYEFVRRRLADDIRTLESGRRPCG